MRFIGDIHGMTSLYREIAADADSSVQVGDYGIGFLSGNEMDAINSFHDGSNHRFIRGNHDDPGLCKSTSGYIPDGTFDVDNSIMYIGGAWSIDWQGRTPGFDLWLDEECSMQEFETLLESYEKNKPKIMVTHDCPGSVAFELFIKGTKHTQYPTLTAQALDAMFEVHQPDIWLFGHWHGDRDVEINGTRFICLGELSYIDLALENVHERPKTM